MPFLSKSQEIFEKLAMCERKSPASAETQKIVREWQEYISEHIYKCDNQMLTCLGELYVNDERFAGFINRFGKSNLAKYFNEAICIYCSRQRDERDVR